MKPATTKRPALHAHYSASVDRDKCSGLSTLEICPGDLCTYRQGDEDPTLTLIIGNVDHPTSAWLITVWSSFNYSGMALNSVWYTLFPDEIVRLPDLDQAP